MRSLILPCSTGSLGSPDHYLLDSTLFSLLTFWHILFTKTLEQVSQQCAGGICSVLIRIFYKGAETQVKRELRQKEKCTFQEAWLKHAQSVSLPLFILASHHLLTDFSTEQEAAPIPSSPRFHCRDALDFVLLVLSSKWISLIDPAQEVLLSQDHNLSRKMAFSGKFKKAALDIFHMPLGLWNLPLRFFLSSTGKPVCLIDCGNFSSFVLALLLLKGLTPFPGWHSSLLETSSETPFPLGITCVTTVFCSPNENTDEMERDQTSRDGFKERIFSLLGSCFNFAGLPGKKLGEFKRWNLSFLCANSDFKKTLQRHMAI